MGQARNPDQHFLVVSVASAEKDGGVGGGFVGGSGGASEELQERRRIALEARQKALDERRQAVIAALQTLGLTQRATPEQVKRLEVYEET
jgi:surface antigen